MWRKYTYAENQAFSKKMMPIVQRIIALDMVLKAPVWMDRTRATDLMVLRTEDDINIGVRVRRYEKIQRFRGQFTLRCESPYGGKTELDKFLAGTAPSLFFYGFANKEETDIIDWSTMYVSSICDGIRRHAAGEISLNCGRMRSNNDGSAGMWYETASFPPLPVLIKASGSIYDSPSPRPRPAKPNLQMAMDL